MYDAFDVFLSFSFSEISKMRACSGKHFPPETSLTKCEPTNIDVLVAL